MLPVQVERQQPGGPFGAGGEGLAQGVDLFAGQRIEVMGHGATQDRGWPRGEPSASCCSVQREGETCRSMGYLLRSKNQEARGAGFLGGSMTENIVFGLLGFLVRTLFIGGPAGFFLRRLFGIHTFGHDAHSTRRGSFIRYTPIPSAPYFYNPPPRPTCETPCPTPNTCCLPTPCDRC